MLRCSLQAAEVNADARCYPECLSFLDPRSEALKLLVCKAVQATCLNGIGLLEVESNAEEQHASPAEVFAQLC